MPAWQRHTNVLILASAVGAALCATAIGQVLTPEQRADPNTGQIPNPSPIAQEYYIGPIGLNQSTTGVIVGAVSPDQASLSWYKFTSDGTTPIIFDTYGTNMGFSLGGFGGRNFGELAVYNTQGQYIAGNQGSEKPSSGDSNIPPNSGPNTALYYRQPINPTLAVDANDSHTGFRNDQGLANLAFVAHPEDNPLWDSSNPNYSFEANWNQFPLLPAGTYFLAVTGYSTYFSGFARDASTIDDPNNATYTNGITSTTPFGFLTFHAMSGTYQLNARVAGDSDLDGSITPNDRRLLRLQIAQYKSSAGIATVGFLNGDPGTGYWLGLPNDTSSPSTELQRYDLTGNQRIDNYDLAAWQRYTGMSSSASLTWNNAALVSGDPLNPGTPGDGVTWDSFSSQNFQDSAGPEVYFDGDTVTFNDNNNGHYAVNLPGAVAPAAIVVNSTGNYTISGTGGITGSGGLTKNGTGNLTISTSNSYTGTTTVTAGTLRLVGNAAQSPVLSAGGADITGGKLLLDYSGGATNPASLVQSTLAAGFAQTIKFSSGQLRTSNPPDPKKGLGWRDDAGNSQVVIAYTYYGDANLDGKVNTSDFTTLAQSFNTSSGASWQQGDFNYDGKVNALDFNSIATNFGAPPIAAPGLGSIVPEPSLAVMVLLFGALRRRRSDVHSPTSKHSPLLNGSMATSLFTFPSVG